MDGNREGVIRRRANKIWEDAGKPDGQDQAHWAQAEREVESARNPVGNGQGDAQADDPNNAMHTPEGDAEGDPHGTGSQDSQKARKSRRERI